MNRTVRQYSYWCATCALKIKRNNNRNGSRRQSLSNVIVIISVYITHTHRKNRDNGTGVLFSSLFRLRLFTYYKRCLHRHKTLMLPDTDRTWPCRPWIGPEHWNPIRVAVAFRGIRFLACAVPLSCIELLPCLCRLYVIVIVLIIDAKLRGRVSSRKFCHARHASDHRIGMVTQYVDLIMNISGSQYIH